MARLSIYPKNKDNEFKKKGGIKTLRRSIKSSCTPDKENESQNDSNSYSRLSKGSIGIKDKINQSKINVSKRLSNNNLSNESLNQLCIQCLSLLRQNKISSENAFEILLIDHLNDIVNVNSDETFTGEGYVSKNSKESKDNGEKSTFNDRSLDSGSNLGEDHFDRFQRAAVTLEASARIYGYRVDSTFDNAYRILRNIKSGQVLSGNSDYNVNEEDQDEKQKSTDDVEDKSAKKTSKKVNFNVKSESENNPTLAQNRDLITITGFNKCRDIVDKPYFIKLLESENKLSRIRYGVEEIGNIGSISSMMMNNLDLKQTANVHDNTDCCSISLRYNVSGEGEFTSNKDDYVSYCRSLKYPLKVNKKTLDLLLTQPNRDSNDNYDTHICSEVNKIIDSIRNIYSQGSINKLAKECMEFKDCSSYFDLQVEDANSAGTDIFRDYKELVGDNCCIPNNEYEDVEDNIAFQEHIDSIYCDPKINILSKQENDKEAVNNDVTNVGSNFEEHFEKNYFNIGQVLDYLVKNSRKTKKYDTAAENKRKKVAKGFQNKDNSAIQLKTLDFINDKFNGVEWIKSLPKNTASGQSNVDSKGKTKHRHYVGSKNKVFVNSENQTSSIFNYNQNHLLCLANISNTKINFESIHANNVDVFKDNFLNIYNDGDKCLESGLKEDYFSYVGNSNNPCSLEESNIDLMKTHCEIEELISEGVNRDITHFDSIESKSILIPSNNTCKFNPEKLLVKSSKTLTTINEQNLLSQKFKRFSSNVDIDFIKENIKKSIQLLISNSNSPSLRDIMKTTKKLISETGVSLTTGVFFICILHICNEEKYLLSYLNNMDISGKANEQEDSHLEELSVDVVLSRK